MFIPYKSGEIDEEVKGSKKAVKVLGGDRRCSEIQLPGDGYRKILCKIHKVKEYG